MKATFYQSINSKCGMCKCDLSTGGYLIRDKKDNIINTLCPICKDTEESIDDVIKVKPGKIVVRKVIWKWWAQWKGDYYHIVSSKNLIFDSAYISLADLVPYLDNPNVDVEIKT